MKGKFPNGLRAAILRNGIKPADLARAVGTAPQNIHRLLNGERKMDRDWAEMIAPFVPETSASELIFAPQQDGDGDVPLVGYVGGDAGVDMVEAPSLTDRRGLVEIEVRGPGMRGLAKDGWHVRFDLDDYAKPPFYDLDEKLCVCWLEDGRVMVKTIQTRRQYASVDLASLNEDTIRDVTLARAVRVIANFQPAGQPKRATSGKEGRQTKRS